MEIILWSEDILLVIAKLTLFQSEQRSTKALPWKKEQVVKVTDTVSDKHTVNTLKIDTLLSSLLNESVLSRNFLFFSWCRSSIWRSSASSFRCKTYDQAL